MGVASGVDEFSGLEVAHLCHHHGEKCIGSNVERNAQEGVRAALIELYGEFSLGNIKLK